MHTDGAHVRARGVPLPIDDALHRPLSEDAGPACS